MLYNIAIAGTTERYFLNIFLSGAWLATCQKEKDYC